MTVIGPGDTDKVRLVLSYRVTRDEPVMKIESGDVTDVVWLDFWSRTLASVEEVESVSLGLTQAQLDDLVMKIRPVRLDVPDDELLHREVIRVDGGAHCPVCGKEYWSHFVPKVFAKNAPTIRMSCSGALVKL